MNYIQKMIMVSDGKILFLGKFQEKGSVIVFVHKHEVADALLREVMRVSCHPILE